MFMNWSMVINPIIVAMHCSLIPAAWDENVVVTAAKRGWPQPQIGKSLYPVHCGLHMLDMPICRNLKVSRWPRIVTLQTIEHNKTACLCIVVPFHRCFSDTTFTCNLTPADHDEMTNTHTPGKRSHKYGKSPPFLWENASFL